MNEVTSSGGVDSGAGISWRPFPNGVQDLYAADKLRFLPARARRSPVVWHAIAALVNVFGDDWLREQTHRSHPIAAAAVFRFNRWRLLRLGVALDAFPVTPEVRARLLTAELFRPCATELDFALLLKVAGWAVKHEPLKPKRGPDIWAAARGVELVFEVKCPKLGYALSRVEPVALEINHQMMIFGASLKASGWNVEVEVSEGLLARAVDDPGVLAMVCESLKHGISRWAERPRVGWGVGPLEGTSFVATRHASEGVYIPGPGFAGEPEEQEERLDKVVSEAADQIGRSGLPGFIVLGNDEYGMLGNHIGAVCQMLRQRRSLAHVSGVIVYGLRVEQSVLRSVVKIYAKAEEPCLGAFDSLRGCARVTVRKF